MDAKHFFVELGSRKQPAGNDVRLDRGTDAMALRFALWRERAVGPL
jgi:hypothetical protein